MNKLVKENINDYLPAPSEEEFDKRLENINDPNELLKLSAKHGYLKGVKKALEQGADINDYNVMDGTALEKAILHENTHIIDYLLENGADISLHDYNDLRTACEMMEPEIIKTILKHIDYELPGDVQDECFRLTVIYDRGKAIPTEATEVVDKYMISSTYD